MSREPEHLELIGGFLAIRWGQGDESVVALEALRRACPCARCVGEPDVTGAVRLPAEEVRHVPSSFVMTGFDWVGHYAVAFEWADGHNTGIYGWDLLRELGE